MLKTHVRPCFNSSISNSSTYSISKKWQCCHLIFILFLSIIFTYSDDYYLNSWYSLSSRQLNNRGFQFIFLKKKIPEYPKGYITRKKIRGSFYFYQQWSEKGVKHSRFINEKELYELNNLIEERKKLQEKLKELYYLSNKSNYVDCILMFKDSPVIDLIIDNDNSLIIKAGTIHNSSLLPIGVNNLNGTLNNNLLSDWWKERSIPTSRSGVREALEKLYLLNPTSLIIKCHGLSLTDQYWLKEKEIDVSWKDINFFDNDFSEDIGEILFGGERKDKPINFSSPDSTSIGNLKKRWKIINGKRVLIKGGSNPFRQEPINEVVASKIMEVLDIDHVNYSIIQEKGYPYSACENFVSKDNELVTAYQINKISKRYNDESVYQYLLRCSRLLGIKNAEINFNKMILVDYLIANEDRHLNNFGFIRDVKSLKFIGFAPIFDSGSSFGFDKINEDIKPFNDILCKPFKSTHQEQLTLIKDFSFINIKELDKIPDIAYQTFKKYKSIYLNEARIVAIIGSLKKRIAYLKDYINSL